MSVPDGYLKVEAKTDLIPTNSYYILINGKLDPIGKYIGEEIQHIYDPAASGNLDTGIPVKHYIFGNPPGIFTQRTVIKDITESELYLSNIYTPKQAGGKKKNRKSKKSKKSSRRQKRTRKH